MPKKKIDKNKDIAVSDTDGQALQILMKEYDALREMYNQSVHHGQAMFNYYLTIMTAVVGGITFISQPSSGIFLTKTTIGLLLIFFAVIGSFYLSSLSTNFAHATRYARGANELRRFIIERHDVPVPSIYAKFMAEKHKDEQSRTTLLLSLFIPVSTYQLFAATVNSLAWALVVSLAYYGANSSTAFVEIVWRGILTFVVTYVIYSVYARLIYQLTISRSNISIGH